MYTNDKFSDLCKGPHIPNTKYLKHFKLTKLGGAYWRGDEDNHNCKEFTEHLGLQKKI